MIFIQIIISILLFTNPLESTLKDEFYKTLASNNQEETEALIAKIKTLKNSSINQAYIATLTMKQSDFEKIVKNKISLFKEGATTLNNLILENPNTLEMRFLRFIIQDKAPKILKYNSNLENDKKQIIIGYKNQNKNIQQHIISYTKESQKITENELLK